MFEYIKEFTESIRKNWDKESIINLYPYIDEVSLILDEFEKICHLKLENTKSSFEIVSYNILDVVHKLLCEILKGLCVNQQISINPLNRALIENFIVLSFIVKYKDKSAEVYIAHSEIEYQKFILKLYKNSDKDIKKTNLIIEQTRKKFSNYKLGSRYDWVNPFLGRDRSLKTSLKILSKSLGLEEEYNQLTLLNAQTHSASALSQYMNSVESNSYLITKEKFLLSVQYLGKVVDLVFGSSEMTQTFWKMYNNIKSMNEDVMLNFRSNINKG